MADLTSARPDREGGEGPGQPGGYVPGERREPFATRGARSLRAAVAVAHPRALWAHHRLFSILVLASLVPRVLASLGFRPALTTRDSFDYMYNAVHLAPEQLRPAGYPLLLRVLEPFHSLLLVTSVQHLLGIGVAVIVYGMLRHWRFPGWVASLAALPTLFDYRQIALESYVLPDAVYGFVIVAAVALLLTKRSPGVWQCMLAGLLIAYGSVLRGNGLPFIVVALVFMLIRRVGWRAFTAGAAAAVLPVLAYMTLFYAAWGKFTTTNSDGFFLWSRTTTFANCEVIKPPPDLVPLCPRGAYLRGWGPTPSGYLWAPNAWYRRGAHPGISAANDALAMRFAIAAIEAQPMGYLKAAASDVLATFLKTDRHYTIHQMAFTAAPDLPVLPWYWARDLRVYGHTSSNTHAVGPCAHLIFVYERMAYFPGLVFLGTVIAGFAGLVRKWRCWGGPGAFPWAVAAISIVLPPMLTWYTYRYALVAVPLSCMAAVLAFARTSSWPRPADPLDLITPSEPGAVPEVRSQGQVSTTHAGADAVSPSASSTRHQPGPGPGQEFPPRQLRGCSRRTVLVRKQPVANPGTGPAVVKRAVLCRECLISAAICGRHLVGVLDCRQNLV